MAEKGPKPGVIAPLSDRASNLWIPIGVRDEEKPMLSESNIPFGSNYNGVAIPFSLFRSMLTADTIAQEMGVSANVVIAGICRFVFRFGVEETKNFFKAGRKGSPAIEAYFENIIKLEKIRCAVKTAVQEVLGLEAFQKGDVLLSATEMGSDPDYVDRIFETADGLERDKDKVIDFFSARRELEDSLLQAIPRTLRASGAGTAYVQAEAGMVRDIIGHRGGHYKIHRGGDKADGAAQAITECLREAVIGWERNVVGEEIAGATAQHWVVDSELNGFSFSQPLARGQARGVDYYYLKPKHVDSEIGQEFTGLRLPALPWRQAWLGKNMRDQGGGLASGQVSHIVRESVNPVLRRYIAVHEQEAERALLRSTRMLTHKIDGFMDWAKVDPLADPSAPLIPLEFSIEDFNDVVRVLCEEVSKAACALLASRE